MDACKSACDKGVHDHCFQMDGTRHITLADYRGLTKAEADAVQFAEPHQLPLHLPIAGFHNWVDKSACLALKVYGGDTLLSATPLLSGLPPHVPQGRKTLNNLHISLYRRRGYKFGETKAALQAVERAAAGMPLGTVKVTRIGIKKEKGDYWRETRFLS